MVHVVKVEIVDTYAHVINNRAMKSRARSFEQLEMVQLLREV